MQSSLDPDPCSSQLQSAQEPNFDAYVADLQLQDDNQSNCDDNQSNMKILTTNHTIFLIDVKNELLSYNRLT